MPLENVQQYLERVISLPDLKTDSQLVDQLRDRLEKLRGVAHTYNPLTTLREVIESSKLHS